MRSRPEKDIIINIQLFFFGEEGKKKKKEKEEEEEEKKRRRGFFIGHCYFVPYNTGKPHHSLLPLPPSHFQKKVHCCCTYVFKYISEYRDVMKRRRKLKKYPVINEWYGTWHQSPGLLNI